MIMSAISENPLTWAIYNLSPKAKDFEATIKLFQKSLSSWAAQIQQTLLNPSILASILNGNGVLLNTSLKLVSFNNDAATGNQTIECLGAASVAIRVNQTS